MPPTVEVIREGECDWALVDREGYLYPHGIKARRLVSGACEPFNGRFCIRHAQMAVERSIEEESQEPF